MFLWGLLVTDLLNSGTILNLSDQGTTMPGTNFSNESNLAGFSQPSMDC